MNNEELAAMAQAGDREALLKLWTQVRRMVYQQAMRWAGVGGTTLEDLEQAGFIAVLRAVDTYDPTKAKFSTYLFRRLRAELSAATGYSSKTSWFDPLQSAVSLDAPLTDEEDATLADFIPDPAAAAEMGNAEVRIGVAAILAELPEDQQRAVRGKYWHDLTVDKKTLNAAMKRLRHPDCSRRLKAYL